MKIEATIEAIARFHSKYIPEPNSGCWLWLGATLGQNEYGGFCVREENKLLPRIATSAHRFSYWLHYGGLSEDKNVLHKCDTPLCVNPWHLFLGTQKDNMRDMSNKGRTVNQNTGRTVCRNGHALEGINVKTEVTGFRRCQPCRRLYEKQLRERKRQSGKSGNY